MSRNILVAWLVSQLTKWHVLFWLGGGKGWWWYGVWCPHQACVCACALSASVFFFNHCPGKYLGWCLVLVQCFRQSAHDFYHMESFHQLQPKGDYTPSLVLGPFTSNQRYSRTHWAHIELFLATFFLLSSVSPLSSQQNNHYTTF